MAEKKDKSLKRQGEIKKSVALVGPILCNSGIATVIRAIKNGGGHKEKYNFLIFHTSNYKDSGTFINLLIFLKSLFQYLLHLMQKRIDLSHIHTSFGRSFYRKFVFVTLSSLYKVPTILHFHSSKFDDFFMNSKGIRRKIIIYTLRKTNAVVVLCGDWRNKLEAKFGVENVSVIHNPVPLDDKEFRLLEKRTESGSVDILFLGFLIRPKGIYDLLEAVERLSKRTSDFRLLIGGKGEEEGNLRNKIRKKNLKNIEFLGWVSGEKKLKLFKESHIFVLPSYNEGMPMVILEALAFGLPVISTHIAGIPEMVFNGENGYLLKPGDINGLVSKMEMLISDPFQRQRLGEKSWDIAKSFRKEKIASQWFKLYFKLLNGD